MIRRETINAPISVTKIVIGIYERNLPRVPGKVKRGIKTTQVVAVAAISGVLNSCKARSADE